MPDETMTTKGSIRQVIEECRMRRGWPDLLLAPAAIDELAERIDRALFGDGTHEDSVHHWRANAADEKRKKQHVSGLLSEAHRELEALKVERGEIAAECVRTAREWLETIHELNALKAEVRLLPLKIAFYGGGEVKRVESFLENRRDERWVDRPADELPLIAAILREPKDSEESE